MKIKILFPNDPDSSSKASHLLPAGPRCLLEREAALRWAWEADGALHAEKNILNYMARNNIDAWTVGASKGICPACAKAIEDASAEPATPLLGQP